MYMNDVKAFLRLTFTQSVKVTKYLRTSYTFGSFILCCITDLASPLTYLQQPYVSSEPSICLYMHFFALCSTHPLLHSRQIVTQQLCVHIGYFTHCHIRLDWVIELCRLVLGVPSPWTEDLRGRSPCLEDLQLTEERLGQEKVLWFDGALPGGGWGVRSWWTSGCWSTAASLTPL